MLKWIENRCRKHVWLYYHARRVFIVFSWLFRIPHEKEFAVLRHLAGRSGVLLDIGANDGVSMLSMRLFDRTNPIVTVEPNPQYVRRLTALCRRLAPASLRPCATGDQPGMLMLYVPSYRGYPMPSFSSLDPKEARDLVAHGMFQGNFDPDQVSVAEFLVPVETVDTWKLDPIFVKIDVQGAEMATLRGMRTTLIRCKPVLLIERNPSTFSQLREWLEALQYRMVDYRTLTPQTEPAPGSVNAVFWPWDVKAPLTPESR